MKKRVFIAHGWDGYPEEGWFPWLKKELEAKGFEIYVPQLPEAGNPRIHNWVPKLAEVVGTADENTYFVGHSMGCQTIARYLETLPEGVEVGGAVFVAGFFKRLTGLESDPDVQGVDKHWLGTPLNFERVKSHLPKSVAIFSDNDPYVPLDNQDDFRDKLGSEIVVEKNMGHFSGGSDGVTELPIVLKSVFKIAQQFFYFMNSDQQKIIREVAKEVKQKLEGEDSGHDWWHIVRVWNMAKHIGAREGADMFVVELAALIHDIADWKFHDGDDTVGPKMARQVLEKYSVPTETIDHVCDIIVSISFRGAGVKTEMKTLEGKVVQDSDRLDAIGAIGIGRTFVYGGHKNRPMYDPNKKPSMHQSKEEYFKSESPTINHFYEKLLLLKDRMNTKTAKELAEDRHWFMEEYLDRFFKEWDGKI